VLCVKACCVRGVTVALIVAGIAQASHLFDVQWEAEHLMYAELKLFNMVLTGI